MNNHYLVVTALGSDKIGILDAFTKIGKQCGSNIVESRLTSAGEECALFFHFAGTWGSIAKLEAALPSFAQQNGFNIHTKRTLPRSHSPALPYQVQVVAQDRAGILNELVLFFSQFGISIDKMHCETYHARNDTLMATITFAVNIPVKQHIASVRERFISYCEDRNLDALIEPSSLHA